MRNLIIIALIIIAIIAIGAFALNRSGVEMEVSEEGEMMEKDGEAMMEKEVGSMMEEEKMMSDGVMMEETSMKSGSYEAYSPEKLTKAEDGKVVLFFRASWCPTCRALDSNIKANLENIPGNLIILDVDYDNSTALKQKYGVTYQHTLVQVDASGGMIKKWTNSQTLSALASQVI